MTMRCPLCNHHATQRLTDRLRHGERRPVYYCPQCELGMLPEKQDQRKLQAYYGSEYRRTFTPVLTQATDPAALFATYAPFQAGRLALLRPHLTRRMRLLEIGCSAGMFLYHVRPLVREAVGVDYDVASARYAARKCRCRVLTDCADDEVLRDGPFDAVCLFQTLEHVKDPVAFMRMVRRFVRPGGLVHVEVPNLRDALLHLYDLPRHRQFYFHRAHLWYFTARSLRLVMRAAGWSGRIRYTQDYNLLNHLHWADTDTPQQDCLAGLSAPRLPLRSTASATARRQLNAFLTRTDAAYRQLLTRLGMTANMAFIGRAR